MTEKEIKQELNKFKTRIFNMRSSEANAVKKELDAFIEENNITVQQLQEFAESGAGEMLYMLID